MITTTTAPGQWHALYTIARSELYTFHLTTNSKGMTIENATSYTLHIHFSGPVSHAVVVPKGTSESVELAVGDYQVAAEVADAPVVPFFGRQSYQPLTHYWLKFYAQAAPQGSESCPRTSESAPKLARLYLTPPPDHVLTGSEPAAREVAACNFPVTFSSTLASRIGAGDFRLTFKPMNQYGAERGQLLADIVVKRNEAEETVASARIDVTGVNQTVILPRIPRQGLLGSPADILQLRLISVAGKPCLTYGPDTKNYLEGPVSIQKAK